MTRSLIDVLERAKDTDRSIRFVESSADDVVPLATLWQDASLLLGGLQRQGVSAGDQVVIFTKSNRQFLTGFWAAVMGGVVPVPVAVGISDEHRHKLLRILDQLESGFLLTDGDLHSRLIGFAEANGRSEVLPSLLTRSVRFDDVDLSAPGTRATQAGDALAFIQYSSGSTGDPKGVCLTHNNVCTNIDAIVAATGWRSDDMSLSWMPLTHDMGLIGYHLSIMAAGAEHAVMDTNQFVRRPLQWMEKAHELRATQLCSPNFGYKHFLKLFERKGLPAGTDLSSVRLILNGAEPISAQLCNQFLDALAPLGLKRSAMFPVYGLAEATVGVTVGTPGSEFQTVVVDRHSVVIGEPWKSATEGDEDAVTFVKVGRPINDVALRIVDDSGDILTDGRVGHIQLKGGSVTSGIYGDPDVTQSLFSDDGWLHTGDCGAMIEGELVVTGRQKDLIIVNGQNYLPHDLEDLLSTLPGLDLNKVVVASAPIIGGEERERILVFVLHRGDAQLPEEMRDAVIRRLGEQVGLQVDHVIPVARIPKTTSGKVQRAALVRQFMEGEFDDVLVVADESVSVEDDDPLVASLLQICAEHAKDVKIGADDNLFEVGVSSLTLSEIVLGIDEQFPGQLDISDLFDVPSIREVAQFLRDKGVSG
ncbi:MAG: non-ribosomal peptide synthetase [Pseudomonadota bacterium]